MTSLHKILNMVDTWFWGQSDEEIDSGEEITIGKILSAIESWFFGS